MSTNANKPEDHRLMRISGGGFVTLGELGLTIDDSPERKALALLDWMSETGNTWNWATDIDPEVRGYIIQGTVGRRRLLG